MAEVVVQQGAQAQQHATGISGDFQNLMGWFAQYWWVILLIIIIIAVAVIVIYLIYLWGLKQKRKDLMYLRWERAQEACKLNAKKNYVVKVRRWKLILFGFITAPFFALVYLFLLRGEHWLTLIALFVGGFLLWIPFAWFFYKDFSLRIIGVDQTTFGYYRGHAKQMDGYIYTLMKVGRKWLVLDDNIIVRVPQDVKTIKHTKKKDIATGEMTTTKEWDSIELGNIITQNENGWYWFIPFTAAYKESEYFYDLSLVDKNGQVLDLRQKIQNAYHLSTGIEMAEREYSHLGKVTDQAVNTNVGVTATKKLPERDRDVRSGDPAPE